MQRFFTLKSRKPGRFRVRVWWGKVDSNHRRRCQQIYSLSPLATREFPHIPFACSESQTMDQHRFRRDGGAGRRTRTPDLLITNQLLYQLSYTSTARTSKAYYSGKGVICQVLFFFFRQSVFFFNPSFLPDTEKTGGACSENPGPACWRPIC